MKLHRHNLLGLAAGTAAMSRMNGSGRGQDYPSRPLHLIVGFAAGGPLDTGAPLIAQALAERLHQSFVIENRVGVQRLLPS